MAVAFDRSSTCPSALAGSIVSARLTRASSLDQHPGAIRCRGFRDRQADTRCSSKNDDPFVLQSHGSLLLRKAHFPIGIHWNYGGTLPISTSCDGCYRSSKRKIGDIWPPAHSEVA